MSKDYLRDYATEAYRFYGRVGSLENHRKNLYLAALEEASRMETGSGLISNPTEAMVVRAEAKVDEKISELLDLEAVEKTINEFLANGRDDIVKCIKQVYIDCSNYTNNSYTIKDRVIKASISIPVSERTIYYNLKKARLLFAYNRGLRI